MAFLEVPGLKMRHFCSFFSFAFSVRSFAYVLRCCVFVGFLCVSLYLYVFHVLFLWFFGCFILFHFVEFYFYLYCLEKRSAESQACTPALWHHPQ